MHLSTTGMAIFALITSSLAFKANIVAIGASITFGSHSSAGNGYRDDIQINLVKDGHDIQMVGTQISPSGFSRMRQPYSEGYPGYTIRGVESKINETWDHISPRPNIITTLVGTNDMLSGNTPEAVAGAPARFMSLLDTYRQKCPECVIVVSSLPPAIDAKQNENTKWFNEQIKHYVEDLAKDDDEHVLFVDANTGISMEDDMWTDGVHPNDLGYAIIGQRIAAAIEEADNRQWITPAIRKRAEETRVARPFTA